MNAVTKIESDAVSGQVPSIQVNTTALVMSDAAIDRMMRVADIMASGRATVPKHLQNNPGDCMAVTMQAMQWGMNPFAVAQKTHVVNGALGYEAQLVNAVVQSSGAITGRFHYEYDGQSPKLSCRAGAIPRGEEEVVWTPWLCENTVTTKNSPLWKTNVPQQMAYLQTKNWSRLYAPGAILGVYTPDELDGLPKDMGAANIVSPWTPEQLAAGNDAASNGAKAYIAFWKALGPDVQKALAGTKEHEDFKDAAQRADAARTVDTPAPEAAKTDTATGEIVTTVADVRSKIEKAKNEDALYVAIDWLDAVPEPEREQARPDLEALFNKRLVEMRGE